MRSNNGQVQLNLTELSDYLNKEMKQYTTKKDNVKSRGVGSGGQKGQLPPLFSRDKE